MRSARLPTSIEPIRRRARACARRPAWPSTPRLVRSARPVRGAPLESRPPAASRRTCRAGCCRQRRRPPGDGDPSGEARRRAPGPSQFQIRAGAVHDLRRGQRQGLRLVVHPHAVRRAEARRHQPGRRQVRQVVHAGPRPHEGTRPAIRRRGCGRACRRGPKAPRPPRAARGARHGEARREGNADATVGGAIPCDLKGPAPRPGPSSSVSRSRAGTSGSASIRHLPTVARSPPADLLEIDARVPNGLHREHGGRPAQQELECGEPRRRAQGGRSVRGLERPDAFANQSIRPRSSAWLRKSVWQRCTWA